MLDDFTREDDGDGFVLDLMSIYERVWTDYQRVAPEKIIDGYILPHAFCILGEVAAALNKYDKAVVYYQRAVEEFDKIDDLELIQQSELFTEAKQAKIKRSSNPKEVIKAYIEDCLGKAQTNAGEFDARHVTSRETSPVPGGSATTTTTAATTVQHDGVGTADRPGSTKDYVPL